MLEPKFQGLVGIVILVSLVCGFGIVIILSFVSGVCVGTVRILRGVVVCVGVLVKSLNGVRGCVIVGDVGLVVVPCAGILKKPKFCLESILSLSF